jgi:hypothetical protein
VLLRGRFAVREFGRASVALSLRESLLSLFNHRTGKELSLAIGLIPPPGLSGQAPKIQLWVVEKWAQQRAREAVISWPRRKRFYVIPPVAFHIIHCGTLIGDSGPSVLSQK